MNDRPTWGPPTPPLLFVVGAGMYVRVNQGYSMCQSSVGVFGQAVSSTTAFRCGVVSMIYAVSLVLLAAGGITALIGAPVRLGRSS